MNQDQNQVVEVPSFPALSIAKLFYYVVAVVIGIGCLAGAFLGNNNATGAVLWLFAGFVGVVSSLVFAEAIKLLFILEERSRPKQ